ncbi:hypothetical protein TorRG33x02_211950 [Trema orientale]|uniref:Uncharacterized protein n=1 Tax=Trema orientale TaxID=63057 RepID=A0A2P5EBS3_TREOI|nr:hypothetical protein TorRG33x02_211950 [Trema orientale]
MTLRALGGRERVGYLSRACGESGMVFELWGPRGDSPLAERVRSGPTLGLGGRVRWGPR